MEISAFNRQIITSFVNTFISQSGAESCLVLSHADFALFNEYQAKQLDVFTRQHQPFPKSGTWNLVLGDFPFGMRVHNQPPSIPNSKLTTYSLAATFDSLQYLSKGGYGIYSIEPSAIAHNRSFNFREHLQSLGYSIAAIFNSPDELLKPYTSFRPVFIVIKFGSMEKEFVGELETPIQAAQLVENFFSEQSAQNLASGIFIEPALFPGFSQWKIQQQISLLDSEYKRFTSIKLKDVSIAINLCKTGQFFTHTENSIYIPKIKGKSFVSRIATSTMKHQNYYQLVCNAEKVEADYLVEFFQSKLGQLIVDSMPSGGVIPNITMSDILEAVIALPSLSSQKEIVNSIKKLSLIKEKISSFEVNLALNPISSEYALKQIDLMLEVVGELAVADKVKSIIRTGESKNVEFKETLSLDVKTQAKEKYIEDSVIKTIAAFLNTNGGTLLVGVNDEGQVEGLAKEIAKFHKNNDKFLLHFKNLLKVRIGEQFYPFIENELVTVDEKLVLVVECKQSPSEIYVDDKDFYVRTNPATDKLEGPKLVAYIRNHFGLNS